MQVVSDSRIDSLFHELTNSQAISNSRREELLALFRTIVFEWDKVSDIDFSIVNIEVMNELLQFVDEFTEIYCGGSSEINTIFNTLMMTPRVLKKRLL